MKRVVIFFNGEPVTTLSVMHGVTSIRCKDPSEQEVRLDILSATFPSVAGEEPKVLYVASDRDLTSEEIMSAHKKMNRVCPSKSSSRATL